MMVGHACWAIRACPDDVAWLPLHNGDMLDVNTLKAQDLSALSAEQLAEVAAAMLQHIGLQSKHIDLQSKHIGQQSKHIAEQAKLIKERDIKIEKITFELADLKRARYGAKTERMNAEQRQMFEEALDADQAALEAQLEELTGKVDKSTDEQTNKERRQPKRKALPEDLPRTVHHHEPADTTCPTVECGQQMVRVGEDVSEKLDVVPAQFFVHRHIRGKWACKCCQLLVQEPVAPHVIDKGMPAEGLIAYMLVSRFVDHIPYYRQESINARSGVHTPRSTLSAWAGRAGVALTPLFEALRQFVLSANIVHADETPVQLLDPGAGKTKRAYVWAYARGAFDAQPGVVYEFCPGRGAKYPAKFLQGWSGTLVCDDYKAYDSVLKLERRIEAGCQAHARRKFEPLAKDHNSPVATLALQRIAWLYRIEREAQALPAEDRLLMRQTQSKPMCEKMLAWLKLERQQVADGSAIAKALDYSINRWGPLTAFLDDADVPIDNNHIENLIRPWAMGRGAWLFAGSELAGQRAAMVMSLVQTAKLYGHDPLVYLKDVLTRLPTHLNSRIDELLPHRWQPLA